MRLTALTAVSILVLTLAVPLKVRAVDLIGPRFKFGQPRPGDSLEASVLAPWSLDALRDTAKALMHHPDLHFRIAGHAGRSECAGTSCNELALRRATLVYRYLLDAGVDPRRVTTLGEYGASRPLDGNWEQLPEDVHQRVEIEFAPDPLATKPTPIARTLTVPEVESAIGTLHGQEVSVRGYARVAFEEQELCPSDTKPEWKQCLWFHFPVDAFDSDEDLARYEAERLRWQEFNGQWIVIRGVIDATGSGHVGSAFAEITNARIVAPEAGQE
jgi:hypothetical protein